MTKGRTDEAMVLIFVPVPRGDSAVYALDIAVQYVQQVSPFLYEYLPGSNRVCVLTRSVRVFLSVR